MLQFRYVKLFKIGLPIILAIFALDMVYAYITQHTSTSGNAALEIGIGSEKGVEGHNTIGIDENTLKSSAHRNFLHFTTLGGWNYNIDAKTPCPQAIQELSGHDFDCVGFMYPLQTGDKIKDFCLLRSTQTCCYGPRPQFNQYILVEMKEPVKFQRMSPVMISGKFFVEPRPDDGYIYRMEGDKLTNIGEDTPDIDPIRASNKAKLPLFDYAPLMSMSKQTKKGAIPHEISSLDRKQIVVAGYCVNRDSSTPPRIIVAKSWWDGVSSGTPPTIHNAIAVFPANKSQVPPLWKPYQVFTGTLSVTRNSDKWGRDGILQLRNAQLGVPGVTKPVGSYGTGQFVPVRYKLLILAAFLLTTLKLKRRI